MKLQIAAILSNTLVIISIMLGIGLTMSTCHVYHASCRMEKESELRRLKSDSLRSLFYASCNDFLSDTIRHQNPPDKLKSQIRGKGNAAEEEYREIIYRLKLLTLRVAEIEDNEEKLISDTRQETNNIINKFNGWTGFWIAVLAIFGGGLPIIIQFVLSRKTRMEYESMLENIRLKSANNNMQLLVSTLWVDYNCSAISEDPDGNITSLIKVETVRSFQELIDIIESQDVPLSDDNVVHLINALIQCFRLIDVIKLKSRNRRVRRLNAMQSKIRELIHDLSDRTHNSTDKILRRLHDLSLSLYNLNNDSK